MFEYVMLYPDPQVCKWCFLPEAWENTGSFPTVLIHPRSMPVLDQLLAQIPYTTWAPCTVGDDWPSKFMSFDMEVS